MTPKALLIPIAAFAVTVTGVHAFNPEVLREAGLSESQIEAFVEARELTEDGDRDAAREVLKDAGVDMDTLAKVRTAMHHERHEKHTAISDAVEANDFAAFKAAVAGSPIADIVTDAEDFARFREAHELRKNGEWDDAKDIMEELGFTPSTREMPGKGMGMMMHKKGGHSE